MFLRGERRRRTCVLAGEQLDDASQLGMNDSVT